MSCYHPRIMKRIVSDYTGEVLWKFSSESGLFADGVNEISIPCGKCIGCKLDNARSWADRMMLELDHSKIAVFATLTYDNEHLSFSDQGIPTLSKKDVQHFLKRLRERFDYGSIRYYVAGEYGPTTHRPHYHAIIYGISLEDFPDREVVGCNPFSQNYYNSDKFSAIWRNGFTTLSPVSWRTCAYVARYVQKKAFGDDYAVDNDVEPEFALMSRRPGIAGFYALDHPDFFKSSYAFVSNLDDIDSKSKKIFIPRYVLKNLDEINPALYYQIKSDRSQASRDRLQIELSNTSLDVISYMEMKEVRKLEQSKKLFRKEL